MGGIIDHQASWPLSFQMSLPQSGAPSASIDLSAWSHELYRGPENQLVKVLYSNCKQESEQIAQEFLNEKVLGFDMEWNWYVRNDSPARLQERIGLIQIACEDKIALFHIGLHRGTTPDELIAPSLRKLLESPDIIKTGVNIINADVSRLRQWFQVYPRGNIELSHLHNLVTYGIEDVSKCTTKLFSLQKHVEEHLGCTLPKGDERMSRWSGHLSSQQKKYAAADAYAGFMLYHCMNAKRIAMTPMPPHPIHAELYAELEIGKTIHLQSVDDGFEMVSVIDFFQPSADVAAKEASAETVDKTPSIQAKRTTTPRSRRRTSRTKVVDEVEEEPPETEFSLLLFERLKTHRSRVSSTRKVPPYIIASDKTLRSISRRCPLTEDELLAIHGVGPVKIADFGNEWLGLVAEAIKGQQSQNRSSSLTKDSVSTASNSPRMSKTNGSETLAKNNTTTKTTDSEIKMPPSLHTGLSFSLEQTDLSDDVTGISKLTKDDEPSSSSAFETDSRESSPSDRKRKR